MPTRNDLAERECDTVRIEFPDGRQQRRIVLIVLANYYGPRLHGVERVLQMHL